MMAAASAAAVMAAACRHAIRAATAAAITAAGCSRGCSAAAVTSDTVATATPMVMGSACTRPICTAHGRGRITLLAFNLRVRSGIQLRCRCTRRSRDGIHGRHARHDHSVGSSPAGARESRQPGRAVTHNSSDYRSRDAGYGDPSARTQASHSEPAQAQHLNFVARG